MKKMINTLVALMISMFSLSTLSLAAKEAPKKEKTQTVIEGVKLILPDKKEIVSVPGIVTKEVFITTSAEDMKELVKIIKEGNEKKANKKFEELLKQNKAGIIKENARIFMVSEDEVSVKCYVQELNFPIYILKSFVKYKEYK